MTYKVTAPLITATTENGVALNLYFGDVVPSGLSKESMDHLSELGFIESDEAEGAPQQRQAAGKTGTKPSAPVKPGENGGNPADDADSSK